MHQHVVPCTRNGKKNPYRHNKGTEQCQDDGRLQWSKQKTDVVCNVPTITTIILLLLFLLL
jgi:hypothetical protein